MRNYQPTFASPQVLPIPAHNAALLVACPARPVIYNYSDNENPITQSPTLPRQREGKVSPKWKPRVPERLPLTLPSLSGARSVVIQGIDGLMAIIAQKKNEEYNAGPNPLLQEMYAPQPEETIVNDTVVTGKLPKDLHGMFATVGPNPQFPAIAGYHIFEGDGSVVTVRIRKRDGRVSFAYTHLETEKRAYERSIGRSTTLSVTGMRGFSGLVLLILAVLRKNLTKDIYEGSLANTNIELHGGKLLSLMDTFKAYELGLVKDGTALQITQKADFGEYTGSFAAHPVAHPSNGCLYSVSYCWQEPGRDATVTVLDSNAKFLRSFPLDLGRKPMIHDAAITEKYLIILDFSVLLVPEEILKKDGSVVAFHSDKASRIGLLAVDAVDESGIIWFEIPSASCYHTVNAYDTDDGVVLHLCRQNEFDMMKSVDFSASLRLVRYDIDITNSTISWKLEPTPVMMELPYVNKEVYGKPAKYAFGSVFVRNEDGTLRNAGIGKYDLENSALVGTIRFQGLGLGESMLTMRENPKHESDGYLTAYVRDTDGNTAMHVFDANTMQNEPLAQIHAPDGFHIPAFAFHSQYISENALDKF